MARRLHMSANGILISRYGKDALSGNYDDLLLDGTRRNSRAFMAGYLTGTGNYVGDYTTHVGIYRITLNHGLGYIPYCNLAGAYIDENNIYYEFLKSYSGSPPSTQTTADLAGYILFYDRLI